MKSLQDMAKELFIRFAKRECGVDAQWEYLNKTRQLAWMEDVTLIANTLLQYMQKEVKPIKFAPGPTTYTSAYNQGKMSERNQFLTYLEQYKKQLANELADFEEG